MQAPVHNFWLLAIALTLCYSVNAQDIIPVTLSPTMVVEESIATSEVDKVSAAAQTILNEYARSGHLTNAGGTPTQRAGNDFQNLFKATATVFADYLEYPGGQGDHIASYRRTIMDKFPDNGFPYIVSNAELTGVSGEGFRFFIATLQFKKSVKKYVDGRGRIRSAAQDGSRDFILKMTVEISVDDLTRFKIRSIVCADKCGRPAADRTRYLTGALSIGLPLTASDLLPIDNIDMEATGDISFDQTLHTSIGVRYTTNRFNPEAATKKNLFLTVGADLSVSRFRSRLLDYALNPIDVTQFDGRTVEGDVGEYVRLVDDVILDEEIRLVSVDLPLGLSYRIFNDYDRVLMVDLVAKPSFVLGKSVAIGQGRGRFDGLIPAANFSVLNDYPRPITDPTDPTAVPITDPASNPFNACECDEITREESPLQTGFGLWLQLSPTYYTNLDNGDPALGLQFSLDLAYNVSAPISTRAASEAYYQNPRGETGVLANGYFDHGLHYIGIRVGVYLHKVTPINIR